MFIEKSVNCLELFIGFNQIGIYKKRNSSFWYDIDTISKYPVSFDTELDMKINIPFHTKRKGILLQIIPIKRIIKRIYHVLTVVEKLQKKRSKVSTPGLAIGFF